MESLRSMIFWGMLLNVVGLFSAMPSSLAQDEDRTTAGEVVDRETLQAFVLGARDYAAGITSLDEAIALVPAFRNEGGPWKHGNTYLIILELSGVVRFHAAGAELDGTDLAVVEDDSGELVFPKGITQNA